MNDNNKESSAISRGCFAYKGKRKQLKLENYLDGAEAVKGAKDSGHPPPPQTEAEFARGKWLKARSKSLLTLLQRLSTEGEMKLKKEMHSKLFGAVCEFVSEQTAKFKIDEIDSGNE